MSTIDTARYAEAYAERYGRPPSMKAMRKLDLDVAAQSETLPCQTGSYLERDQWSSDHAKERRRATERCQECPVRKECLASAVERGERAGTWGGVDFGDGSRSRAQILREIAKRAS